MDKATEKKIIDHYQKAQGSIQDIARVYKVTVNEVLDAIGQGDANHVSVGGDLVDQSEAGPEAKISYGKTYTIDYDVS